MDKLYALFVKNAISKISRKTAITCNLDTYLVPESKELYNMANNNKTFEILFAFEDKEFNPEFTYLFQIFSAKAEDKDLSASGEDNYDMSIPLRSFGERLCRVFRVALPKARDAQFVSASTWTDAGEIVIRPNVPVISTDVTNLSVLDSLKKENGEVIAEQTLSAFTVDNDGFIHVAESAFSTTTDAAYREVSITLNGETLVRTFAETETDVPDPVTNVEITVKAKKAMFTWTDPSDADLDHVLIDVQDNEGKSVISGSELAGIQAYTATGLSTGATYIVDFIAVDKNGNKSEKVSKTFETSAIVLGAVTNLAAAKDSSDYKVTWTDPTSDLTGVRISVYDGDTLLETSDVVKATETYTITSTLVEGDTYKVVAVPYKTLTDAKLLGTSVEVDYTAE